MGCLVGTLEEDTQQDQHLEELGSVVSSRYQRHIPRRYYQAYPCAP